MFALLSACDKHEEHAASHETHEPLAADKHHEHAAPEPAHAAAPLAEAANPVQAEMRLLSAAMEEAVRGIGAGDVRRLEHLLHGLHGAKETTEKAIAQGEYRPPKNGDKTERFRELDEAFHKELERLVSASRDNDVPRTAEAMGRALVSCHGCHSEFRP
jgi:hypothetical protein